MTEAWKDRKVSLGSSVLVGTIVCIGMFFLGMNWNNITSFASPYVTIGNNSEKSIDWSPLNEVYGKLVDNYDGEIDKNAVVEGAKAGLTAALGDKYTVYMTAEEANDFNADLHGEAGSGIGVIIAERDGYVRVVRTTPDNPARKAGILAGDIIYKVDGEKVYDLDAETISKKLRGAAGSDVEVTVVRDHNEKTFKLTREEINNVSADVTYDGKTAIILVTRFDTDTGTKVREFAKDAKAKGCDKIILDLRNNGGGYVSSAVDMLGLWIDGQNVLTQKTGGSSIGTSTAHGSAILADTKTVVLVNGSTASASEIVAGALQDYKKATILGTKTYGKGVVQSLLNLSGGSLLKVTTAHWFTPNDTSINGVGIKPDVEVDMTYDQINANKDPQMDKAKEL